MSDFNLKDVIEKVEDQMKAVGRERDKIDNLIGDLTSLRDACEEAYDALWDAREALSEIV